MVDWKWGVGNDQGPGVMRSRGEEKGHDLTFIRGPQAGGLQRFTGGVVCAGQGSARKCRGYSCAMGGRCEGVKRGE